MNITSYVDSHVRLLHQIQKIATKKKRNFKSCIFFIYIHQVPTRISIQNDVQIILFQIETKAWNYIIFISSLVYFKWNIFIFHYNFLIQMKFWQSKVYFLTNVDKIIFQSFYKIVNKDKTHRAAISFLTVIDILMTLVV